MAKQLQLQQKQSDGKYEKVFPVTTCDSVKDEITGKPLSEQLAEMVTKDANAKSALQELGYNKSEYRKMAEYQIQKEEITSTDWYTVAEVGGTAHIGSADMKFVIVVNQPIYGNLVSTLDFDCVARCVGDDYNNACIMTGTVKHVPYQGVVTSIRLCVDNNRIFLQLAFKGLNDENITIKVYDKLPKNVFQTSMVILPKAKKETSKYVGTMIGKQGVTLPEGLHIPQVYAGNLASNAVGQGASQIGIADVDNYYASTNIEGALAELAPRKFANFHNAGLVGIVASRANKIYNQVMIMFTINSINVQAYQNSKIPANSLWGTLPQEFKPQLKTFFEAVIVDDGGLRLPFTFCIYADGTIVNINEIKFEFITGSFVNVGINYLIERI